MESKTSHSPEEHRWVEWEEGKLGHVGKTDFLLC